MSNIQFLELVDIDIDVLPYQMLPTVKEHLRVDFDRDDQYIRGCIARAISEVQAVTDISINPATYKWGWTDGRNCSARREEVPKWPVRRVFTKDATGTETTIPVVRYENRTFITGGHSSRDLLVDCGYKNIQQITPHVMSAILMLTGTLYEQREAVQAGSFHELPDMARRLFTGLWRPAV
jgi:hypothetical protein